MCILHGFGIFLFLFFFKYGTLQLGMKTGKGEGTLRNTAHFSSFCSSGKGGLRFMAT